MRSARYEHSTKIRYLQIGCIVICSLIVLRLIHLQINLAYHLHTRSQKNFLRVTTVRPARGNILDANGKLLATNRPISNVCWTGTGQKKLSEHALEKLEQLERILSVQLRDNEELFTAIKHAERRNSSIELATDLSLEQLSKIEELFPNDPNVRIVTGFKRLYPHNNCACHVLGYLGRLDVDPIGRMGLEQACEKALRGEPGSTIKTIDSVGKSLAEIELKRALTGQDINTTLDIDIQAIAEEVFPAGESGTIIVMDAQDGAIRALMSRPTFNPNIFADPINDEEWKALQENRPFLNRAFNACYPPGSIFKLITVSAALEQGMITQDASWYCNGYLTYHGRRYWCHLHQGHGSLSTCQAVAHSCNILFFTVGKRIDIDLLAHYANTFGLGVKTNVPFPEKEGIIPSRAWKRSVKGERWWQGETLSAAIGQSFLLVTPIQVARMIASIFTGYLVTPRLLEKDPVITTPLNIRPETIDFLQRSMMSVVTRGTGQRVSSVKNVIVHAKTSTAQTSALQKRDMGKAYMEHAWFVGHVQYKKHRPFVIVILIENGGSSSLATLTAKNFLQKYKLLVDGVAHEQHNEPLDQTPWVYEWTDPALHSMQAGITDTAGLASSAEEEMCAAEHAALLAELEEQKIDSE